MLFGLMPAPGRGAEPASMERGRQLYAAYCVRCHGIHGDDLSYPNIKSLVDITRQMPAEEILLVSTGFAGVTFGPEEGAALLAYLATFRSDGYARPEMLVDPAWVEQHGQDANVRVVDARSATAYAAGHIPGAIRASEGPLRNAEDSLTYLPKPETFAAMMGAAGIGNSTHVVIYDDQGGRTAARLWYVLSAYGHERASLVNGGWNRWIAEKRSVETTAPAPRSATFVPRLIPEISCSAPELLARKPGVVVLDARAPAEYQGTQTSGGATKAGRVPGAINVEWRENVTGPEMIFKPAAELRRLYASRGITPDKEIIAHCASGGRSAHTVFTLKLLGYPKVRNYYGSFSDYTARPDAPVEK
jgi:thiosulfate/3-mercaptopyruvate sulfurtransferase